MIGWKYWGKQKFEDFKYTGFTGEVLEWDPGSAIARIRFKRNNAFLKLNLQVNPAVSFVLLSKDDTLAGVGEITMNFEIKDKSDEHWEKLFCPVDTVLFEANRFVMSTVKTEDTLAGAHFIRNLGPANCQEIK